MNAIELAIRMETDAISFYKESAEKTAYPVGKKMFLSVVEDEKRHLKMLRDIFEGLDISAQDVSPMKNVKTVFEQYREEMLQRVEATDDELNAFKIAMDMEQKGLDFYRKTAQESATEKEKSLFERLALEEEQHYQVFSNTYYYMKDTGNWFMWEERSMVDGGTPTA